MEKKNTHKEMKITGRASREEEDPQGPREEENNLHTTIRQRHTDRWQEKGMDRQHHHTTIRRSCFPLQMNPNPTS